MTDIPDVKLVAWVRGDNEYHERGEASPSEVLEAARQHVDYEAAWSRYKAFPQDGFALSAGEVKAIIDAALGIEGEEGT